MQSLIATWAPGSDPAIEAPVNIRWNDGSPATLGDYVESLGYTYEIAQDVNGALVRVSYPSVSADVRFDAAIERWVCQAPGDREVLDELNPGASDEEIIAELATYPEYFRHRLQSVT